MFKDFQVSNCIDPKLNWHELTLQLAAMTSVVVLFPSLKAARAVFEDLWTKPIGRMHEPEEAVVHFAAYTRTYDLKLGVDVVKPIEVRVPRINILSATLQEAQIYLTSISESSSTDSVSNDVGSTAQETAHG